MKKPISLASARLALALFLCAAGTAHADWQYTMWGMTHDQVVSASSGAAVPVDGKRGMNVDKPDIEAKLSAPYQAGPFIFDAVFFFTKNGGTLDRVQLWPKNKAQCSQLQTELGTKYGKPIHAKADSLMRTAYWKDEATNNTVSFTVVGGYITCYVSYDPVNTAASSAL